MKAFKFLYNILPTMYELDNNFQFVLSLFRRDFDKVAIYYSSNVNNEMASGSNSP